MTAVFKYIKEHLDDNEQAIFELSEECRVYGQQLMNNRAEIQSQLQNNEQNLGKIVDDAKDVFAELKN